MKRILLTVASLLCLFLLSVVPAPAAQTSWMDAADTALQRALSESGVEKGDANLLLLTNAGYAQIGEQSTESFIESGGKIAGCSMGARSLLPIHASLLDPFWFALFRKDTGKLVFVKWTDGAFHRQVLDASPEKILTPEGWKAAASGLIAPNLFSVVSISRTWTANPPWPLLFAATFHDHFCPGVNSGYCAGQYVMDNLPLDPGDKYVFVTAPAKCAADALQVMFNTTSGKSAGYSMAIGNDQLYGYAQSGVQPMTVAMRVNQKKDVCTGLVLGFDWSKAYELTGVKADELSPQGGPANPMFWITRVKMSYEMARIPREQLKSFIVELKSFSGNARMADQVGSGDPYAALMK